MHIFKLSYHLCGETTPLVAWIEARDSDHARALLECDRPHALIDRIYLEA